MLDLKIVNGRIVDGTGAPAYEGSVGVRDGRIVAVGKVDEDAKETIDAKGKVVSPGFIDVHTHYDAQAFWDPTFSPSCYHGVTTILGGFCGFSIAPLTQDAAGYLLPMLARVEGMPVATLKAGVPWDWTSFGSFLGRLDGKVALNAGFFVGHSAVRRVVMGERAVGHKATPDDLAKMKRMVADSLAEGAIGFSTTVSKSHNDADGNPVPSRHAAREEILALAEIVRDYEGTSLELLPDLDFGQETLDLLADFSLAAQRPVNWNALGTAGATDVDRARVARQLSATDHARRKGAEVIALTLPCWPTMRINLYGGFVFDALPGWAPLFRMSIPERIELLKNPAVRAILDSGAQAEKGLMSGIARWETYTVAEVQNPKNKDCQGLGLDEIARRRNTTPFNAMIDIAIDDRLLTSFMPYRGGEDAETYAFRSEIWKDDRTIIGASDAGAHMDMIDTFAISTTFLQRARDYGLLPLEQSVHQLTQIPAEFMGIRDRGLIREGYYADLTIFDPDKVACGPVYTRYDLPGTSQEGRLYADAIGVEHVIVNGRQVVRDGKVTDERPGTVLRSGRDTYTVKLSHRAAAA